MDIGIFRGVITAILMALFIALVFWAYSRRRQPDFDAAARLPLDDDRAPHRDARSARTAAMAGTPKTAGTERD
jgi:cytochrome c oxidase cbb3-type subunit 4